jgi:DNA-binding LytR/AlgR family response regulator
MKLKSVAKKIGDNLSRPYPMLFAERHGWAYICATGLIIALLINLEQPFGLHTLEHPYKWLILSGFGFINAAACIVVLLILSKSFPPFFSADNWTVGKEAGIVVFLFIVAGIINWTHAVVTISHFKASWSSFFLMEFYTFIFACLPVTALALFIQNRYLKRKKAEEYFPNALPLPPTDELLVPVVITINEFRFNIHTILYLKAEGNYVGVHFYADSRKESKLCRITLKKFEKILNLYPQFIRCKKSYIVNMHKVTDCKGNAERMILKLENCPEKVEVSRMFVPAIRKIIAER